MEAGECCVFHIFVAAFPTSVADWPCGLAQVSASLLNLLCAVKDFINPVRNENQSEVNALECTVLLELDTVLHSIFLSGHLRYCSK